jgi:hypothetical protein
MRLAGDGVHGARMRALIVLLWRAGLRINEALTLTEHHLEPGMREFFRRLRCRRPAVPPTRSAPRVSGRPSGHVMRRW